MKKKKSGKFGKIKKSNGKQVFLNYKKNSIYYFFIMKFLLWKEFDMLSFQTKGYINIWNEADFMLHDKWKCNCFYFLFDNTNPKLNHKPFLFSAPVGGKWSSIVGS